MANPTTMMREDFQHYHHHHGNEVSPPAPPPPQQQPKEGNGAVPSGFILKLYQMVNGAPDDVICVSRVQTQTVFFSVARKFFLYATIMGGRQDEFRCGTEWTSFRFDNESVWFSWLNRERDRECFSHGRESCTFSPMIWLVNLFFAKWDWVIVLFPMNAGVHLDHRSIEHVNSIDTYVISGRNLIRSVLFGSIMWHGSISQVTSFYGTKRICWNAFRKMFFWFELWSTSVLYQLFVYMGWLLLNVWCFYGKKSHRVCRIVRSKKRHFSKNTCVFSLSSVFSFEKGR